MLRVGLSLASALSSRAFLAPALGVMLTVLGTPPANAEGFFQRVVGFLTGSGEAEIGVEVETPNVEAQGPAAIAAGSGDALLIVDTLNRRIVRVRRDGTLIDTLELRDVVRPVDVAVFEQVIYVLDALGQRVSAFRENGDLLQTFGLPDTIELNGTVTLTIGGPDDIRVSTGAREARLDAAQARGGTPAAVEMAGARSVATPEGVVTATAARGADDRIVLRLEGGPGLAARGGAQALKIASTGFLAGARLLGIDSLGRIFVLVDELPADGTLAPRTVVKRFSPAGELTGQAVVPLEGAVYVPNRPVTVTEDGSVFALIPGADEVALVEVDLDTRSALPPLGAGDDVDDLEVPRGFEDAVAREYADEMLAPRGTTSRADIIARVEAYLETAWRLDPKNYPESGTASRCDPDGGAMWRRPQKLDGQMGATIVGLPYKWGGYDSLDGFQRKLGRGDLAGDVCTCRSSRHDYCLVWNAAGVDCSGFVSRAFGASYHTTSRLHEITTKLERWTDLKPGDIVNRRGRHVRLVTGISTEVPVLVHVIESAVSCHGMCRASYEVSQLRGYEPRRYNFLADP